MYMYHFYCPHMHKLPVLHVHTGVGYLRVSCLCDDVSYSVGMTSESVNAGLGAHVPHPGSGVPASRHQDIDGGM